MPINKLTRLAILTALSCVLRFSMSALPNVKPITALFFVIMLCFGLSDAILVSALTMILTGLLMGFSIIILGQIVSYAIILTIASILCRVFSNIIIRTGLVFLLTMLYGFVISIFSAYLFGASFWPFWLGGLTFDLAHAISTSLFFPIIFGIFNRLLKQKVI